MIEFIAFGHPKTAGSKRAFFNKHTGRAQVVDACKDTKSWQHVVASAAMEVYQGELLGGALAVEFDFYFPRPKGHYNRKGIKPSAPEFHTKKPDALKLARAVEDALTGVVWRDDAQIVSEVLHKHYGEPARVEVVIRGYQWGGSEHGK